MNRFIHLQLEPLHARITPVAGALDTTFGANGIVTQQIPGYYRTGGESVLVQPDGKIIVAGLANDFSNNQPAVFRYNADGTPDTQFSGDGFAILDIPGGGGRLYSTVLLPNGKIVACGTAIVAGDYQIVVIRLNADGTADKTFGKSGIVLGNPSPLDENGFALALQSDGKIVVVGDSQVQSGSSERKFLATRFTSNGALDVSFGANGFARIDFGPSDPSAKCVLIQPDGKIVLGGASSTSGGNFGYALARLNANGTPDGTFGVDGTVKTSPPDQSFQSILDAVLLPDGKILAVGAGGVGNEYRSTPVLLRYNIDGSPDTTFDGDGMVTTDLGFGGGTYDAVALQPHGEILVAGTIVRPGGTESTVARYLPDGNLDTSFGTPETSVLPGVVTTDIAPDNNDAFFGLAVQKDGKIVAAGMVGYGQGISLARYTGGDRLPPTASPDEYSLDEDMPLMVAAPGLLGNDTLVGRLIPDITLIEQPSHGTLRVADDGSFEYHPDDNFNGTDRFRYRLNDGVAGNAVTVTLTVRPFNDAPVAVRDEYFIPLNGGPLVVSAADGVLDNDIEVDGDPLTATLVSSPSAGTLTFNPNGSFTFVPPANFIGEVKFRYRISDGLLDSDVQTVTIGKTARGLVSGTKLTLLGTDGADSVRILPSGSTGVYVELVSRTGVIRRTYRPAARNQRFTMIEVNLAGGNDYFDASAISVPVRVTGGAGNDYLRTGSGSDTIFGDTPAGGGTGRDLILSGPGNDRVVVGDGDALIDTGNGWDTVTAGNGDNRIDTGAGNDAVMAGNGDNRIDVGGGNDQVSIGDGFNVVYAGSGSDRVSAGSGQAFVDGAEGNDHISVVAGSNTLLGGAGNDVLLGGTGDDVLEGESGDDLIVGGLGSNEITGGDGDDILIAGGIALKNPVTDSLQKVLASYDPARPDSIAAITDRLIFTPNGVAGDTLTGEFGVDWFWMDRSLTVCDIEPGEPLRV